MPSDPGPLLPVVSSFTALEELRYADDDDPDHVMSAWVPDGTGPFPAAVLIHGGGWQTGGRVELAPLGRYYAARGIASFSLDYQKSAPGMPTWPLTLQDVICAVRHIKGNAEVYDIDPNRIAVVGFSAGGHLAAMVGTLQGDEPLLADACGDSVVGSRVVLTVSYAGPADLDLLGEQDTGFVVGFLVQLLGATYAADPDLWRVASPHTYISGDDPVFVLVHGTADTTVPQESTFSFSSQLDGAGVENHLIIVEGAGHTGGGLPDVARPVIENLMGTLLFGRSPPNLSRSR